MNPPAAEIPPTKQHMEHTVHTHPWFGVLIMEWYVLWIIFAFFLVISRLISEVSSLVQCKSEVFNICPLNRWSRLMTASQCPRPNPQQIGLFWHIRANRCKCPTADAYSDQADRLKCKGSCLYNLSFPPKTPEFNHWWVVAPSEEARLSQQAVSLK